MFIPSSHEEWPADIKNVKNADEKPLQLNIRMAW